MPNASVNDAKHATVNPAWAQQSVMAAHRVAKLPTQQDLMGEVFRDTRFPHQPSRKTLVDTIKVLSATGNVTGDQAQWLADNSGYPNRLWSAIGGLSQTAANDPERAILNGISRALLKQTPVRDIAYFVTQWAKHLPEVIDPQLIAQLHAAKRTEETGQTDRWFDWHIFNATLESSVQKITRELNRRMHFTCTVNGNPLELTPEFGYDICENGALMIGADHSMGIEFPHDVATTQTEYWQALVMGLTLMQRFLFPISTSGDLIEQSGMMFDEIEEDLSPVWNYLAEHDLDDSPENIEQALAETEPCMIEDAESFEQCAQQHQLRTEILNDWTIAEEATIVTFKQRVAKLGAPETEEEKMLANWFNDLLDALPESDDQAPWWDALADRVVSDGHIRDLDEFTPVYGMAEHVVQEAASEQHDYFMQGDDREAPKFDWRTDPKILLAWAESMRVGQALTAKLLLKSESDTLTFE